jgi:hypothetical protein
MVLMMVLLPMMMQPKRGALGRAKRKVFFPSPLILRPERSRIDGKAETGALVVV